MSDLDQILMESAWKPSGSPATERPNELALLAKALRAMESGIMVADGAARISWVNPAFCRLVGYTADELIGRTPALYKSGRHDQRFYRRFWDTILCGETWRGEFINRRRDGCLEIHSQIVTPVRQHGGGPITQFIAISEASDAQDKPEEAVPEIRSRDMASRLAAGIAHHLNNFLMVIQGNSQLLLNFGPDGGAESRKQADRALGASEPAAHFVRRWAGFSRSEVMQPQALDLNQVVTSSLVVFRRNFKGIEWEPHLGGSLPRIYADSNRLVQVITHLLVNALDAMPGGGRLTLSTEKITLAPADLENHEFARPGEFVCLAVRDTGCGIPSANLDRIFEPFFSTKEGGGRCGLGLALVDGIVKQHQGWIEASSPPGQGATFKIFLPALRAPVELAGSRPPSRVEDESGPAAEQRSGVHIIVATGRQARADRGVPLQHWGINE